MDLTVAISRPSDRTIGGKLLKTCIAKSLGGSAMYLQLSKKRMYALLPFSCSSFVDWMSKDGTQIWRLENEFSIKKDLLDLIK